MARAAAATATRRRRAALPLADAGRAAARSAHGERQRVTRGAGVDGSAGRARSGACPGRPRERPLSRFRSAS